MISIYLKEQLKKSIIIFLLTLLITFILISIDKIFGINKLFLFIKFNLIIIILSILQILNLKKKYPKIYLVNPPVLCTIFTFLLPFVLSNIFISPIGIKEIINFNTLNKIYYLLINSLNLMWLGYWFGDYLKDKNFNKKFFFQRIKYYLILERQNLNFTCLSILVLISLTAFLFMTYFNIYGYTTNISSLKIFEKYLYLLRLTHYLNYVVLTVLALFIFTKKSKLIVKFFFLLNLFLIFISAFVSGFKSDLFYPLILIFIIFYIVKKRISYLLFFISIFFLYFSFYPNQIIRSQIEKYNINSEKKDGFENIKLTFSLFDYYYKEEITSENKKEITSENKKEITSENKKEIRSENNKEIKIESKIYDNVISELRSKTNLIGSRMNALVDASNILEFYSLNIKISFEKPRFLESILISPITAIVPRIIWTNKPYNSESVWATNMIYQHYCYRNKISPEDCLQQEGSTAMSSFLYLYFAGGSLMIFIFYFLLGFFQNIIYNLFKPGKFFAPTFIYIFALYKISVIDTAIYGIISFFFREFIILIIIQYLIFKKKK